MGGASRRSVLRAALGGLGGAAAALAGLAALAGCSPEPGERDRGAGAERPDRGPLQGPASPSASQVAPHLRAFFGDELIMRDRGAFGLDDVVALPPTWGCAWRSIRVGYPAGSASQATVQRYGAPSGGAQVYLLLRDGPRDEAHLSYRIRFQKNFRFARGGKLPGLFGGTHVAGGNVPDGTNGFSTRYMWRSGGEGQVYAYLPASTQYGTTLGLGTWRFVPGQWTAVQQRVRLNTPGLADGSLTVWIDGWEVFRQDGLVFRHTPTLRIEGVFFSTFFGGDDLSWASPIDQYADFATFAVSDGYIVAGPAGLC